jgi:hypothetical protein
MIEDGEVRRGMYMRTMFGFTTLSEMPEPASYLSKGLRCDCEQRMEPPLKPINIKNIEGDATYEGK